MDELVMTFLLAVKAGKQARCIEPSDPTWLEVMAAMRQGLRELHAAKRISFHPTLNTYSINIEDNGQD